MAIGKGFEFIMGFGFHDRRVTPLPKEDTGHEDDQKRHPPSKFRLRRLPHAFHGRTPFSGSRNYRRFASQSSGSNASPPWRNSKYKVLSPVSPVSPISPIGW